MRWRPFGSYVFLSPSIALDTCAHTKRWDLSKLLNSHLSFHLLVSMAITLMFDAAPNMYVKMNHEILGLGAKPRTHLVPVCEHPLKIPWRSKSHPVCEPFTRALRKLFSLGLSSNRDQLSHSFRWISHKSSKNCGPRSGLSCEQIF